MCSNGLSNSASSVSRAQVIEMNLLLLDLAVGVSARSRAVLSAFAIGGGVLPSESPEALAKASGLGEVAAKRAFNAMRTAASRVAEECRALSGLNARVCVRGLRGYPSLLSTIPDPPVLLRVRGELPMDAEPVIAIVGSRRPSDYGMRQADLFARFFAEAGVHVVSGGARGIDAAAHRAAIAVGGRTSVILGAGLARPYPPEHARLFSDVLAAGGAIASEVAMETAPRPALFPRRNRIVSGMSLGVLVIEAAARSGALITARLGVEEQGRDAMALPGRIDDPMSAGCLRMLSEGWAALVRSPQEALDVLNTGGRALLDAARECRT